MEKLPDDANLDAAINGAPATGDAPLIRQDTLDETQRAYLQTLVENRPFAFEIVLDERYVKDKLAAHWPHEAADIAQAGLLWDRIDEVVQSIPAIKTTPVIVLHVIVSASPLVPQSIPSPQGYAALATFDANDGKFHHTVLPGLETLPPLEVMKVPAGLMVIAQPVPPLMSQFTDNRSSGLGASNVYTERSRDLHLPQHKNQNVAADPAAPAAPPKNTLG